MQQYTFIVRNHLIEKLQAHGVSPEQFDEMLAGIDDPANCVKVAALLKEADKDDEKGMFSYALNALPSMTGSAMKGLAGFSAGGGVLLSRQEQDVLEHKAKLERRRRDQDFVPHKLRQLIQAHPELLGEFESRV